uniref:Fatty acyl-CoA reductase n=1 Tax=Vitrella brassicaformis TaxID=1169539 RepID=A0A7S1K320_9ALVE|mmetsp:Transcript_36125/g.90104  ORF Transcript_36125/g.90104 Transcript_36125/m.90104 type:complete len:455 (+) Transcript_36125:3-1367(+)
MQLAMSFEGVRSSGCFVHVSTAYANSNRSGVIEEKLYESDIDHEHTFSELNRTTGEEHQRLAEQLRVHYGHPNNYTFTKWLAEHLIGSRHGDLPTLIIRPSIIGSTYRTPFNGWTSAPQGFGALVALGAFGAFLRLPSDGKAIGDVIPADYVASASLRATVQMAGRVGRLEVMHVASSHANPVTWSELSRQAVKGFDKLRMYQIPQQYMISPRCVYTWCSSSWRYALMHALDDAALVLAQLLVSLLGVVFPALGKQLSKPVRFLCRRQNVLKLLHHFICNQWIFKTDKIRELAHREHDPDFPLDVENIKWEPWCIDYVEGLCRYSLIPTLERITKREKEQATHAPDKPTTTTTTHRDTDRDRDSPSSTSTSATTTSSTSLGMCNPCCQSSNHPPESPPPSPSPVVESDESSEGKGRSDGAPLMSSRKISGTTTEGDTMALPSDVSNDSIERACC